MRRDLFVVSPGKALPESVSNTGRRRVFSTSAKSSKEPAAMPDPVGSGWDKGEPPGTRRRDLNPRSIGVGDNASRSNAKPDRKLPGYARSK